MKTCPICKARCFDDMEVCYGCMHRFDENGGEPVSVAAKQPDLEANDVAFSESKTVAFAPIAEPDIDEPSTDVLTLRDGATRNPPTKADGAVRSRPHAKKSAPQVFGAAPNDEDADGAQVPSPSMGSIRPQRVAVRPADDGKAAKVAASKTGEGGKGHDPQTTPLAIAPLGNGYRLVITLERE